MSLEIRGTFLANFGRIQGKDVCPCPPCACVCMGVLWCSSKSLTSRLAKTAWDCTLRLAFHAKFYGRSFIVQLGYK